MAAGAVSLRKSHDIIILSFCNIVKGQAKYNAEMIVGHHDKDMIDRLIGFSTNLFIFDSNQSTLKFNRNS